MLINLYKGTKNKLYKYFLYSHYESFVRGAQAEGATTLLAKAKSVPYPNSAWWNRSITQYEGRSGREELERMLRNPLSC